MKSHLKFFLIINITLLFEMASMAQTYNSGQQLVAQDKDEDGKFGENVLMFGNWALVGARYSERDFSGSIPFTKAGAAYLFERDTLGNWSQIQKFSAWDREQFDEFGAGIAMDSNYIVIGSPKEDDDEIAINTRNLAGSVYIYKRNGNTWNYQQKIVASDRSGGDNFGSSVAIWNDYILVGAPNEDNNVAGINGFSNAGSAYFFKLNSSSNTWNEVQKVVPSDRAVGDNFGYQVSFSGGNALITAPGNNMLDTSGTATQNNTGSIYSFVLDTANIWVEIQQFGHLDKQSNDSLGVTMSVWRDELIVGSPYQDFNNIGQNSFSNAGAAYYFKRDSLMQWQFVQKLVASDRKVGSHFGKSVSIHDQSIIIGSPFENTDNTGLNAIQDAGAAYVFSRNSNLWNQHEKLVAYDRDTADVFGWTVSTYNNKYVIGAYLKDYLPWFPQWHNDVGSIFFIEECVNPTLIQTGLTLTTQTSMGKYQWLDCGNNYSILPNDTMQSFTATMDGSYAVEVRKNGCIDTSACYQVIGVGINKNNHQAFSVYPNPADQILNIKSDKPFQYRIFDVKGAIQKVGQINSQSLDISNLHPGIYFLELSFEDITEHIKLVKQ